MQFRGLLTAVVLAAVFSIGAAQSYVDNIDVLFKGYNAFTGVPLPLQAHSDPGIATTDKVYSLSYSQNQTSGDHRFWVPDNVTLSALTTCASEHTTSQFSGAVGMQAYYAERLSADISSAFGASFSLSGGIQAAAKLEEAVGVFASVTVQECQVFAVAAEHFVDRQFHSNFVAGVTQTAAAPTPAALKYFLDTFGTHVVSGMQMGSVSARVVVVEAVEASVLEHVGVELSEAMSADFIVSMGFSSATSAEEALAAKVEAVSAFQKTVSLGAPVPVDDDKTKWQTASAASPYPIRMDLSWIGSVLTDANFPGVNATSLGAALLLFLPEYCHLTPGCEQLPPAPPAMMSTTLVSAHFGNHGLVQCPRDTNLLGCGFSADHSSHEGWPYMEPSVSSNGCSCYDAFGSTCTALCGNIKAGQATLATISGPEKTGKTVCPEGTVAASCGYGVYSWSASESFPQYYPYQDGKTTGCYYYNAFGISGITTCVANVTDYTIVHVSGGGTIHASCPDDSFVLGCGQANTWSNGEPFLAHYPSDPQTCTCYNYFSQTCYAMCGRVMAS